MTQPNDKSTATLLSNVMASVSGLVRGEVDLARAELGENIQRAAIAIGLITGAVVIALVALNVLTAALIAGLTEAGLDYGWSALLVGLAYAGIAFLMAAKGVNDLKLSSLAPTRMAANVKRDAAAVKEAYNEQ